MAKIILDLSGRGGLVQKYHGDVNDANSQPHLRYLGGDDQFAEGEWNPIANYGFMSPANNTYTDISGTIEAGIVSFVYESASDKLFAAIKGSKILELSTLSDISFSDYLTITQGKIEDALLYELNNSKTLIYAIDSETTEDGSYIGFKTLDDTFGVSSLDVTAIGNNSTDNRVIAAASEENLAANRARRAGILINSSSMEDLSFDGARLNLSRTGSGDGVTMRLTIETNSNTAPELTDRGSWSGSSISYAVDDYVTSAGDRFQCYVSHVSNASGSEPGVGNAWEDYWMLASKPTGTVVASKTFALSDVPDYTDISESDYTVDTRFPIVFDSRVTLSSNTRYWFILEEVGDNMDSTEELSWLSTANDNGTYFFKSGTTYAGLSRLYSAVNDVWEDINANGDLLTENHDNFDIDLYRNEVEQWSSDRANGAFKVNPGKDSFLHLSGNGLVYWFTGNQVHSVDGSLTGGVSGTVNEGVLIFPSYVNIPDVSETRGRMYIGVQSSEVIEKDDNKFFNANQAGVFIWDRRSQVQGGTDFYLAPGAKEIKSLFTSSTGDVTAITTNNSGYTELRQISGNQYAAIFTFEKDAFPATRRSVSQIGNMTVWLAQNGIWYGFGSVVTGEPQRVFKLGNILGLTDLTNPGAIYVGNENTSERETAVIFGWEDSTPGFNASKWYPFGEGSIDSNSQRPAEGNVYTKVQQLPGLSTVQYIRGFHMPGGVSEDSTTSAKLKCYKNMESIASWERNISLADLNKGWFEKEWNQPGINFLQFELEWDTSQQIGANTYRPIYLEIETQDEGRENT